MHSDLEEPTNCNSQCHIDNVADEEPWGTVSKLQEQDSRAKVDSCSDDRHEIVSIYRLFALCKQEGFDDSIES